MPGHTGHPIMHCVTSFGLRLVVYFVALSLVPLAGATWAFSETAAQSELRREELVVADLDIDRATRAMFNFDREGCADMLFAGTVRPEEYAAAGPMRRHPESV